MDVFSGAVKRKRRTSSSARTASRGHRAELWRSMFVSSWNHVFFTRRVLKWWVALKFTAAVGRDTADWGKKKFTVASFAWMITLWTRRLWVDRCIVDICSRGKRIFSSWCEVICELDGAHMCLAAPPTLTHTLHACGVLCIWPTMTCPADCAHYQLNQQGRTHAEIKS